VNAQLLVPIVAVFASSAAAVLALRRLAPRMAVVLLTICIALTSVVASVLLLQLAAAGASEIPFVADTIGWCRVLYGGQHGASPIVGLIALAVLAAASVRGWLHLRGARRAHRSFGQIRGVEIIETDQPVAFAVPGPKGGVVISRSLLEQLDRDERHALLAHENAHLRHHHHLYVRFAEVCAAAFPLLRPLASRVRLFTERWADEVAAERVGSRALVAATIAKVALLPASAPPAHALAMGGAAVIERFDALTSPQHRMGLWTQILLGAVMVVIVSGAMFQVHQLADFIAHSGHA